MTPSQTSNTDPKAEEHFLGLGVQYYVAARAAALAGLLPVCGNLYHHAIEMCLKAVLSRTHSLKALRNRSFGHDLNTQWSAFKAALPSAQFDEFDDVIRAVERFEEIRYPDSMISRGAEMIVLWTKTGPRIDPDPSRSTPRYELVVTEVDRLVLRIFEASSRNPMFFTLRLHHHGRETILRDNPVGAKLLGIDKASHP